MHNFLLILYILYTKFSFVAFKQGVRFCFIYIMATWNIFRQKCYFNNFPLFEKLKFEMMFALTFPGGLKIQGKRNYRVNIWFQIEKIVHHSKPFKTTQSFLFCKHLIQFIRKVRSHEHQEQLLKHLGERNSLSTISSPFVYFSHAQLLTLSTPSHCIWNIFFGGSGIFGKIRKKLLLNTIYLSTRLPFLEQFITRGNVKCQTEINWARYIDAMQRAK